MMMIMMTCHLFMTAPLLCWMANRQCCTNLAAKANRIIIILRLTSGFALLMKLVIHKCQNVLYTSQNLLLQVDDKNSTLQKQGYPASDPRHGYMSQYCRTWHHIIWYTNVSEELTISTFGVYLPEDGGSIFFRNIGICLQSTHCHIQEGPNQNIHHHNNHKIKAIPVTGCGGP
jgi:hypothetical protein